MASDRAELLRRVPIFADLDGRELDEVVASLKERSYSAGDTVITEGRPGIGFFVIADGEAVVHVRGEERGRLGPGDYFGEIALIAESERTATVTAETDLRCLGLTSWEFRPLVQENAGMAWKLLQALAEKLRAAEQRAR